MKTFLKDNLILIAGVALPLLLAMAFLAANKISAVGIEPPKTAALYYYKTYGHADLMVKEGKVYIRDWRPESQRDVPYGEIQLYIFDPVSGERKSIKIPDAPEGGYSREGVPVDELKDITILVTPESPDGYAFRNGHDYYNRGLVFDIFGGGGRSDWNAYLQKGGVKVQIPPPDGPAYQMPEFLGWVAK